MAIKLTSTKQAGSHVKTMVHGPSGIGKTFLTASISDNVIISAESGLLSVADFDIPVIEVSSVSDCWEALAYVQGSAEAKNFNCVSLDSITDIAEVMLIEYKKEFNDARQAYGKLADDMGDLIRAFRDLPEKHVYVTAKQQAVVDEYSGLTRYMPTMPGKNLTNGLPYFFDEVLALRIKEEEDGKIWRYLQTAADVQYTAKDRSGKLDVIEKPDLGHIFKKILAPKEVVKENDSA